MNSQSLHGHVVTDKRALERAQEIIASGKSPDECIFAAQVRMLRDTFGIPDEPNINDAWNQAKRLYRASRRIVPEERSVPATADRHPPRLTTAR